MEGYFFFVLEVMAGLKLEESLQRKRSKITGTTGYGFEFEYFNKFEVCSMYHMYCVGCKYFL